MTEQERQVQVDYETYKSLLDLWAKENPIKTTKLQVLLAVNALLVSAVNVAGGRWFVYLAGAVFSFIWMFSIGRTSLFQDVWQIKIADVQRRHPNDPRFAILDTAAALQRARPLLRAFGAISSRWYLLFSPLVFALGWLGVLILSLTR
jgi:hypothetical protein